MPSAPDCAASRAARTGSGWRPPRAFRIVATWSMLTPSRSFDCATIGDRLPPESASAARPVDGVDDRSCAQGRHDRRQVPQILHLDIDKDLKEIKRPVGNFQIADIAAVLADDGREAAEAAGLVAERD